MSDTSTETPPVATTNAASSADIAKLYDHLLASKGEGKHDVLGTKLLAQNRKLGEQLRAAEAKATAAEGRVAELEPLAQKLKDAEARAADLDAKLKATAVPEGHVPVPKADAEALAAYKAIGPDPAKLRSDVESLPTLQGEIARRDREKELGAVASARGYEPSVLGKLADGLTFVPAKVKVHGKEVDSFEVVDADADGKERRRPIAELEESDWRTWMPALKPDAGAAQARTLPVGGSPYRGPSRLTPEPPRQASARAAASDERQAKLQHALSALPLI